MDGIQLVSTEEGLRIAANYRISCYINSRPFTEENVLLIVEQLAHARYLGGLFHSCIRGDTLLDMVNGELVFEQTTPEVREKLKEEFGKIFLFQNLENEDDE